MVTLKTKAEIEIMAEAGHRLAQILTILKNETKAGIPTEYLEKLTRVLIKEAEAEAAFLNYEPANSSKPYPAALCVSVNDTVVHGLPSNYVLKEGDLVKLDLGLKYWGYYVDAALTVGLGKISDEARRLLQVTERALELAVAHCTPGKRLGDIGQVIQNFVERNKFSIIKTLTGHGVGRSLHEEPTVLNFGSRGSGAELEVGMVLAIEPMVSSSPPPGGEKVIRKDDDSFVTRDGSLAAHFEHTVAITEAGPRILTKI
ncbi:MAG: type I methionyl aminopeptidase [Candidatus Liptonbacteria bacterium]|nr:type I methionyl aminopeptidase [Candidatus Liptonbacteria bacterium]